MHYSGHKIEDYDIVDTIWLQFLFIILSVNSSFNASFEKASLFNNRYFKANKKNRFFLELFMLIFKKTNGSR